MRGRLNYYLPFPLHGKPGLCTGSHRVKALRAKARFHDSHFNYGLRPVVNKNQPLMDFSPYYLSLPLKKTLKIYGS
jgi:hypothetical protein